MNLQHIQLFKDVPAEQLAAVTHAIECRYLRDGEKLLSAGQDNHYLFMLAEGRMEARLTLDPAHAGIPIETGESIGELSIIDGQQTSASVYSLGESLVLAIQEDDFWRLFAQIPGVMRNLTRSVTLRLRHSSDRMIRAYEEQLQIEQMKKELAAARDIQMGLLPHHAPLLPLHRQADVHAFLLPAREVGGDLFDAFAIDEDHILLAVGDVSGKGLPAAMFMMRTLTLLRANGKAGRPMEQLLPTLNRLLCEGNQADMFVTLSIAVLSVRTGRLLLMNGGHPPPLLSREGSPFEPVNGAKGALLGVLPEAQYNCHECKLNPGDRLVLYSDGVTEAENPDGLMFQSMRTLQVLDRAPADADMATLVDELTQGVGQFAAGTEQSDDITILALRYRGPNPA